MIQFHMKSARVCLVTNQILFTPKRRQKYTVVLYLCIELSILHFSLSKQSTMQRRGYFSTISVLLLACLFYANFSSNQLYLQALSIYYPAYSEINSIIVKQQDMQEQMVNDFWICSTKMAPVTELNTFFFGGYPVSQNKPL